METTEQMADNFEKPETTEVTLKAETNTVAI